MYEDFTNSKDIELFVNIKDDPEYSEQFKMLPKQTRDLMLKTWDGKDIYVRRDMAKILFGYRTKSISNWIRPTQGLEQDNLIRKAGSALSKMINPKKLKQFELALMEFVKIKKDTIVIKSGSVLGFNIMSNDTVLYLSGVTANDRINGYVTGSIALTNYLKDYKRLEVLKNKIKVSNQPDRYKVTLNNLQSRVDTNPVKSLIDLGQFQSFIEDISPTESEYTYKGKLDELVDPLTSKVHQGIKDIGNNIILGHSTKAYKFLKTTTQYSDFIARFILHEHNLKKGLSVDESLTDISESFVQYDLPTHPTIQYLNDVGIIMFSKFFLRIQKVLLKKVAAKPARALSLFLLNNIFDLESILDSTATVGGAAYRMGNPIDTTIVDQIAPIKLVI